jgi:hypothetical protein
MVSILPIIDTLKLYLESVGIDSTGMTIPQILDEINRLR